MPVTRGFRGRDDRRRGASERAGRLPPGQHDAGDDWPVLTAEVIPHLVLERWSIRVDGAVQRPTTWSWHELRALPRSTWAGDIHCVTAWSRLGTRFTGVGVDLLLDAAGPLPGATHVVAHAATGYTASLPLEDLRGERAWVVWDVEGRPLTDEHGGPVRLLVPHLYLWKSVKWVARLELVERDRPGFWETHGYHDRGDPWLEQRYQGDP